MLEPSRRRRTLCGIVVAVLASLLVPVLAQPAHADTTAWYGTVTHISDGDTITVRWHGSGRPTGMSSPDRVRFAGVDTNELAQGECFAQAATDFVEARIPVGTIVRLEAAHKSSSAEGRALRHVFYGPDFGRNLGLELVEAGLGLAASYQAEPDYRQAYHRAAERAYRNEVGMWAPGACGGNPATWPEIDVQVNYDAPGLDVENLNGEFVRIHNRGPGDLVMSGWSIRKGGRVGPNGEHELPNRTIPAGGRLTIHSGSGADSTTEVYLGLSEPYFRNESDVVYLRDRHLNVRFFKVWPCQLTCEHAGTLVVDQIFTDAPGPDNANPNGEWVRLRNRGVDAIDLTDWRIQTNRSVFRFPAGVMVQPGATLEVRMGRGRNSPGVLHWGSGVSVLSNTRGKLRIYSPRSEKMDCYAWGRAECKSEPVRGAILMGAHYDARGNDKARPNREWLTFENTSDATINLSRYKVEVGSATYRFPKGTKIAPGRRLRLRSGTGKDTRYRKHWRHGGELLQNSGGSARLVDRAGTAILEHRWPCGDCGADGPFVITRVRANAPGNDARNPNGEFFVIRNVSDRRASLRDYQLQAGSRRRVILKHHWVGPGDRVKVRMGRGTKTSGTIYMKASGEVLPNRDGRVMLWSPFREIADCHGWGDRPCPATEQGASMGLRMTVNYDAEGDDAQNPNGEWVDLHNRTGAPITLAGFEMVSGPGIYHFDEADVIGPGRTMRVHSGEGADTGLVRYAADDLYPLSNTHDEVLLLNQEGLQVQRFRY